MRSKKRNSFCSVHLFPVLLFFCGIPTFSQSLPQRTASPSAASQAKIFAKTQLVVLPVSVTDTNGGLVSGLILKNFRVYEQGRPQEVTAFQEGDMAVTVGLIVDHSRSMGPKLPEVAAAVSAFAESSNPQDEMFVVDFNDDVSVEWMDGKPFTNDPKELAKAVSSVRARGRTALYDAVAEGLVHLQLGRSDRKALIIVSDGGDNASQQTYSRVLDLARRSQVVIYSIGLVGSEESEENSGALQRLSKETGGIAFFPTSMEGVADISKRIARDLREEYTLGFVPDNVDATDSFRQIRVKVNAPGHGRLRVRTRPGYFRPQPEQAPASVGKGAS